MMTDEEKESCQLAAMEIRRQTGWVLMRCKKFSVQHREQWKEKLEEVMVVRNRMTQEERDADDWAYIRKTSM